LLPLIESVQTSKHAFQGLMRAMRKPIYERDGIRVNTVNPGVTDTPMTAGIVEKFRNAGLFWQSPESVARITLGIQCSEGMNGKAIYVEGGDGWEFEDSFYRTQPQWLGEEPTRRMRANAEAVNKVCFARRDCVQALTQRAGSTEQGLATCDFSSCAYLCYERPSNPAISSKAAHVSHPLHLPISQPFKSCTPPLSTIRAPEPPKQAFRPSQNDHRTNQDALEGLACIHRPMQATVLASGIRSQLVWPRSSSEEISRSDRIHFVKMIACLSPPQLELPLA